MSDWIETTDPFTGEITVRQAERRNGEIETPCGVAIIDPDDEERATIVHDDGSFSHVERRTLSDPEAMSRLAGHLKRIQERRAANGGLERSTPIRGAVTVK